MDAYAVVSRAYDATLEPMNAPMRSAARRLCPAEPGAVVLDVGCGTGAALAEYLADGCRVIGADASAAMLGQARRRLGPDADLRLVAGDALPVEDGCADLVLVCLVLHSLPSGPAVGLLREARRALRPGGRILVTDFGTAGLRFPRGLLTRGLSAVAELVAGPAHARHCLSYLRSGGLQALVGQAGLRVVAQRPTAGGNITIAVLEPVASPASPGS